jgi:hypothetical protein
MPYGDTANAGAGIALPGSQVPARGGLAGVAPAGR